MIYHLKNRMPSVQAERSKMNDKLMEESPWFHAMPKEFLRVIHHVDKPHQGDSTKSHAIGSQSP